MTTIGIIIFILFLIGKYFITVFGEQPYDDDIPYPLEKKG